MKPTWKADSGSKTTFPAIGDGFVYTVGGEGVLSAYPSGCATGGSSCEPSWTTAGIGSATRPTLDDGMIFVANYEPNHGKAPDAKLFAYPVGCDQRVCPPSWTGSVPGGVGHDQGPVVSHGIVYVPATSGVYAFRSMRSCGIGVSTCPPRWRGLHGNYIFALAAGKAKVLVGTEHALTAFPESCATHRACSPLWSTDLASSPNRIAVVGDVVVVTTLGRFGGTGEDVYAFPIDCGSGQKCEPLWTGHMAGDGGFVAAEGNRIFAEDQQTQSGGVFAFDAHCRSDGKRCEPLWWAPAPDALSHDLTVVDGVVYVGGQNGELYAYPADCSTPCHPSWTAQAGGPGDWVSPAAADGVVYVGSDGLYAFDVPVG